MKNNLKKEKQILLHMGPLFMETSVGFWGIILMCPIDAKQKTNLPTQRLNGMLRLKWLNPQGRDANTKPMHQRTDSINLAYQDTFIRKRRFTVLWASTILSINFLKYDNISMKNMLSLPELWRWRKWVTETLTDFQMSWRKLVVESIRTAVDSPLLGFRLFVCFFLSFFLFVCLFYRSLVAFNNGLISAVQQSESATHIHICRLCHHKALSSVPCTIQYIFISYLFHTLLFSC